MVIASKVKARSDSNNLQNLKSSSKVVAEATAQVIATCRTISNADDEETLALGPTFRTGKQTGKVSKK